MHELGLKQLQKVCAEIEESIRALIYSGWG
jgi:hypothetical protein